MTQNIYQQLGLKQVINACGKMTILGVSSVAPQVMQATARAASAFVEIDRLVDRTGERVSRFTGAEDSYITSCASAGIAIAVAAAITHGDQARVMHLAELGLEFSRNWLKPEGAFLVKVFQGYGYEDFVREMRQVFKTVSSRKPDASRDRSPEVYLLGKGLKA